MSNQMRAIAGALVLASALLSGQGSGGGPGWGTTTCSCTGGTGGTSATCGQCNTTPIILKIGCTQCCEDSGSGTAVCSQKDGAGSGGEID